MYLIIEIDYKGVLWFFFFPVFRVKHFYPKRNTGKQKFLVPRLPWHSIKIILLCQNVVIFFILYNPLSALSLLILPGLLANFTFQDSKSSILFLGQPRACYSKNIILVLENASIQLNTYAGLKLERAQQTQHSCQGQGFFPPSQSSFVMNLMVFPVVKHLLRSLGNAGFPWTLLSPHRKGGGAGNFPN